MCLVVLVCVRTYMYMYIRVYICIFFKPTKHIIITLWPERQGREKNPRTQVINTDKKQAVYSVLLLEKFLLSVTTCCLLFEFKRLQCDLLHPASCTDGAIHVFPRRLPWPQNIFFWALTAHHTLWARMMLCVMHMMRRSSTHDVMLLWLEWCYVLCLEVMRPARYCVTGTEKRGVL